MFLSRVGSVLLVLVSLFSFGLVYGLTVDDKADKPNFIHAFAQQLLQADSAEEKALKDLALVDAAATDDKGVEANKPKINVSVFKREEERDGVIRRTLVVGRGETLTSRLFAAGISRTETKTTLETLRPYVNPRRIRGGQEVVVLFTRTLVDGQMTKAKGHRRASRS